MKKNKLFSVIFPLAIILTFGLACKSLLPSQTEEGSTESSDTQVEVIKTTDKANSEDTNTETTDQPKVEKADFTVTAEELDKEFTSEGVTNKDLEKYASKNIAVTGRVSTLVMEKKGTTQPWVTLYAPGVLHGVSCYFDDDNVEQMKKLKKDKMAKVQGFQNDFIVPKISPRLDHCIVLEAD